MPQEPLRGPAKTLTTRVHGQTKQAILEDMQASRPRTQELNYPSDQPER